MGTISIATFNVNSIKARLPNLLVWLDAARPDIVLLQELKCLDAAFPAMEIEERGYNIARHGQKTYNGVAILSKFPLDDVTRGLAGDPSDEQARYIEAVASIPNGAIRIASAYVPNGQEIGSDKFSYKLRFLERLRAHWAERLAYHEMAVLGGDFNCAPMPIDVYDPAALDGTVCYHPAERERLRALMHLGFYDAFRTLHPTTQQFSWWDYRGNGYERGHGLRIDHLLLSAMAADCLTECRIDETPRQQEKPSDHAPVVATLML
ncbi:MAG: exodeoxyribonuclease III [Alphaproteobacteria bacterium]|nr:exodeoxyribonuclease III [Alphaproteobacteria bacterium]